MRSLPYKMCFIINGKHKGTGLILIGGAMNQMKQYIEDIKKRKDLLLYLVKSGLKAEHRNSYLGYFWWLLDPLLNVAVYYFLVVIILGRGGPDFPVFLVIGLVEIGRASCRERVLSWGV